MVIHPPDTLRIYQGILSIAESEQLGMHVFVFYKAQNLHSMTITELSKNCDTISYNYQLSLCKQHCDICWCHGCHLTRQYILFCNIYLYMFRSEEIPLWPKSSISFKHPS